MKGIPQSKVARWPQSIKKLALVYACCLILVAMLSFGITYAYFSAKVEATGNITIGKLDIQYLDADGTTSSTLSTIITRNIDGQDTVIDPIEDEDNTIMPGDIITINGSVENIGSINGYVVLQAELILMTEADVTVEEKVQDTKFFNLDGTQITYDSTKRYYGTSATLLNVDEIKELSPTNASSINFEVDTSITSELSGRTFLLRLTIHAIQSDNLEEDTTYTNLGVQATNILLTGIEKPVTAMRIYGNSVQNTYTGKNLLSLPYKYDSRTINGITFEVNSDGTIICNGTATTTTKFHIKDIVLADYVGFTISGGYETGSSSTYWLGLNVIGDGDKGSGLTITEESATRTETDTIVIRIASGYTANNLVIKPQLEEGTTATEYEPYVGGIASPNPDYPQEVQSVGEKTKNLFDVNNPNLVYGYINASANQLIGYSTSFNGYVSIMLECNPSTTYTISRQIIGKRFIVATTSSELAANMSFSNSVSDYSAQSLTITSAEDDKYLYVWFYNSTYDTTYTYQELMARLQVEEGTTATEYEPYGYKIPVTTASKNILNINKTYSVISNCTYDVSGSTLTLDPTDDLLTRLTFEMSVTPDTDYFVSGTFQMYNPEDYVGGTLIYIRAGGGGGTAIKAQHLKAQEGEQSISFTFNSGSYTTLYFWFYYNAANNGTQTNGESYGVYKNIMVAKYDENLFDSHQEPARVTDGVETVKLENGFKMVATNTTTSTRYMNYYYKLGNYSDFVGKKLTLSGSYSTTTSLSASIILVKIYNEDTDGDNAVAWSDPYTIKSTNATKGNSFSMSTTISADSDADYIGIRIYISGTTTAGDSYTFDNISVTTDTPVIVYEPYVGGSQTYTIYLDQPLRKVGDYADYIEIKDGVATVVRQVKEYVLDGSINETWSCQTVVNDYGIANFSTSSIGTISASSYISNRFVQQSTMISSTDSSGIYYANETAFYIRIDSSIIGIDSSTTKADAVTAFKTWLNAHVTKLYVQLVTTEETIIELPEIFTLAGNTIYEFGTTIQPSDYYFG